MKLGDRVKTLVPTMHCANDPYTNEGMNYFNNKYPAETIGYITYVNQSKTVYGFSPDTTTEDDDFAPLYYANELQKTA